MMQEEIGNDDVRRCCDSKIFEDVLRYARLAPAKI